jgi:hypothetical protein
MKLIIIIINDDIAVLVPNYTIARKPSSTAGKLNIVLSTVMLTTHTIK